MFALALTTLVLATSPAAGEGSAPSTPAPPSAADSIVAAAFKTDVGTNPTGLKAESPAATFSAQNLVAPGLALAGLAALAFTLKRRKALQGGSIHIIEAASLGEKRSLVIADVLGERLVLGVSEAGVTVLLTRPAPAPEPAAWVVPQAHSPAAGFLSRLTGLRPPAAKSSAAFDVELQESIEDQDLRAKLAAGMRGVIP